MKSFILRDINNNAYLYSFKKRQLCYLNENVYILVSSYLSGKNRNECISELNKKASSIDKKSSIRKLDFFIRYGYLEEETIRITTNLPSSSIKSNIGNVYNIVFEVTQRCNLRCFYCTYGDLYTNPENDYTKDLSEQDAFALIDYIMPKIKNDACNSSYKRIITIGFYGGEPLLNFKLIERIIEHIEQYKLTNCIIEYTMTTNGILLDKYIDYLIDKEFHLMISFDGDRKASSYRYPEDSDFLFNHVLENIKNLQKKHSNYFNNYVDFNSVLHNRNNVYSIIKFYREQIGKTPKISELSNVSVSSEHLKVFKELSKSLTKELMLYEKKLSRDELISLNPEFLYIKRFFAKLIGCNFSNIPQLINIPKKTFYLPTATCNPFSFKDFLSAESRILLCEKIGYKHCIGKISNNKVYIDYERLSNEYTQYYNSIQTECTKCYDFYTCTCCLFEHDFKCKHLNKNEFKNKMEYYINLIIKENN